VEGAGHSEARIIAHTQQRTCWMTSLWRQYLHGLHNACKHSDALQQVLLTRDSMIVRCMLSPVSLSIRLSQISQKLMNLWL